MAVKNRTTATKTPKIMRAKVSDPALQRALNAITETLEVREGQRGQSLDKNVTWRDLLGSNIAVSGVGGGFGPNPEPNPNPNPTPAPDLLNFTVIGGFGLMFVEWDRIWSSYSYVEIWRAAWPDYPNNKPGLASAVLIGTESWPGRMYIDYLPESMGEWYCYWGRSVSTSGAHGNYNGVDGTCAMTAYDPEYYLELLTNDVSNTLLWQDLSSKVLLQDLSGSGHFNEEIWSDGVKGAVDTLVVQDGVNYAAIQQVSQIVSGEGGLTAEWYLKTDVNGYISGFGLYNTGSTSYFLVNADTFAVGKSGVDNFPFFVVTVGQTIDGVYVPPGVYISDAFIANGTIKSAMIGTAAITEAHIASCNVDTLVGDYIDAGLIDVAQIHLPWDQLESIPTILTTPVTSGLYVNGSSIGFYTGVPANPWPIRIYLEAGTGKFKFGNAAGTKYIEWNGTELWINGKLYTGANDGIVSSVQSGTAANRSIAVDTWTDLLYFSVTIAATDRVLVMGSFAADGNVTGLLSRGATVLAGGTVGDNFAYGSGYASPSVVDMPGVAGTYTYYLTARGKKFIDPNWTTAALSDIRLAVMIIKA